mgnify:FL=1
MDNVAQIKYLQNHFLFLSFAIMFFCTFAKGIDFRLPCDSIICNATALENQHIKPKNERERERE